MAERGFLERFGRRPEVLARAPGRVNLIGEHTDYNDGFVLPTAIPQTTAVALARRADREVHAASDGYAGEARSYRLGDERRSGSWVDYVQGTTRALVERGPRLASGFDLFISSTVPAGSGLSSSAALEVALLRGLRELFGLALDDVALALVGQRAENDLVGAPVGVMDQMAASLADATTALFLDTRSMAWERVPLPAELELVVIDSGIPHDHATGDYRTRRAECERAAALLGVASLRDVEAGSPGLSRLPELLARRVQHVVSENDRVLRAVVALRRGELLELGRLFRDSHASLRDDYEVSLPDIDRLVAIADDDPDVAGARLTGGGFGGAIVALSRRGQGAVAGRRIVERHVKETGRAPRLLVPAPD